MQRVVLPFVLTLAALLVSCGSSASVDQNSAGVVTTGGAPWAPVGSATTAEAGAAEASPLTEEELRRMLDALEQEIDEH